MKFTGFCLRLNNKSGIILIVVLWVLAILSVLAIGLGRGARIDLALAKHGIGKLKADGLVWASVYYAMNQIRLDTEKQQIPDGDTFYQCGFYLPNDKKAEDLFKNVRLKDGSFDISYILKEGEGNSGICYGFQDEERRININGISQGNHRILVHLFMLLDLPEEQAQALAAQIVDWRDADAEKMSSAYGAEKDDYLASSKPYGCKDAFFENIEELLLVKDMTEDVFNRAKDHLTVFPQSDIGLSINGNTASDIVLKALFRFIAEQNPSIEISDADSLAEKIISYRQGDDGRSCTFDDRALDNANMGVLGLNLGESAIYVAASTYMKRTSQYFRVQAKGKDSTYGVSSQVDVVIDRENISLVSWKRK